MRIWLSFITIILGIGLSVAHADYEAGKRAYDAGDYETAYQEWLPLAEAGNVAAQAGVSLSLAEFRPASKYFHFVVKWLFIASENGHIKAKSALELLSEDKGKHEEYDASIENGMKLGKEWLALH